MAVEPVPDIDRLAPCLENGATFEENARKKALHYSAFVTGLVFADDSGLCVDALGGAPGIHSARYAGEAASDAENNAILLAELRRAVKSPASTGQAQSLPANFGSAHYVCVIALAQIGNILAVVEGRADGIIIAEPRGSGGFGYDPLFFSPPLQKTFAELSLEEKSGVSHRGKAFERLLRFALTQDPRAVSFVV